MNISVESMELPGGNFLIRIMSYKISSYIDDPISIESFILISPDYQTFELKDETVWDEQRKTLGSMFREFDRERLTSCYDALVKDHNEVLATLS